MLQRFISRGLALLALGLLVNQPVSGAEKAPTIASFSKPAAGDMQILFRGANGPFRIQVRDSLDPGAAWVDIPSALVTEVQPGVYLGLIPTPGSPVDLGFYRIVSEGGTVTELKGWALQVAVSAPANGQFFAVGERPVITVTLLDTLAQGLTRDELSSLNLYMAGPQEPALTVTPLKLLDAVADRSKRPHHYIDLKTNPNVQVNGNTLTYTLKPVSDELPGTYTVSVRAVRASDTLQQIMVLEDVQIRSGTVESQAVTRERCADCHEGSLSDKMYMHHIDPSGTSLGSWSLDYEPPRSCKACHNNDGYAAFSDPTAPGGRVSDALVIRAHGIHMGEGLRNAFNTNEVNGNFSDYTSVVFPADVRNCAACHVDTRWKTEPTRLACGSCHDNVWFGTESAKPAGMELHEGGEQPDDEFCYVCHAPDPEPGEIFKSVSAAHQIEPPAFSHVVNLGMSAPGNGKFYVAGEAPQVMIKVLNAGTGLPVDPATIKEPVNSANVQPDEWRRANLYVSGPRAWTVPVLTTSATNSALSSANNDFRVRLDPAKEDPRVSRTADTVIYQLGSISNLASGTYTVYVEVGPQKAPNPTAYLNFQVGSTNIEPQVAAGCIECHGDTRIHATSRAVTMIPDICKSCHDNAHQMPGKTSWGSNQYGFGVSPLSRRVHGIHFGNYLEQPDQNTRGIAEIIFPQDVRNCTKCHADPKSATWAEYPSRLACLSCHDSDPAIAHGTLMTLDPTPADPWSGDEVESCEVCHGSDSDYGPATVHAIANPYVPPYPRAPRE